MSDSPKQAEAAEAEYRNEKHTQLFHLLEGVFRRLSSTRSGCIGLGFKVHFTIPGDEPIRMSGRNGTLHAAVTKANVAMDGAAGEDATWFGGRAGGGEIFIRTIGRRKNGPIGSSLAGFFGRADEHEGG